MFVIVNKYTNVVVNVGLKADTVSNGIDVGSCIFGQDNANPTYDVLNITVPDGVCADQYCYTVDKGFYTNPDYVKPISQDDVVALKQQTAQMLLALVQGGLM